jgi:membrane protein DedA with SNARE-associated domain
MHHVDQFLASYGYFALFGLLMLGIVGPLIPDETILVLAGIAVHRGQMHPMAAIVVASAGSMCGITMSYMLGRTGVVYALKRFPPLERYVGRHLPEANRWFERFGKWTLFFGYFIVGVRHFTAVVAGTSGLRARTFALYAYPGGCIWVTCFVAMGYFLGEGYQRVAHKFNTTAIILAAIIAAAGIVWWLFRKR